VNRKVDKMRHTKAQNIRTPHDRKNSRKLSSVHAPSGVPNDVWCAAPKGMAYLHRFGKSAAAPREDLEGHRTGGKPSTDRLSSKPWSLVANIAAYGEVRMFTKVRRAARISFDGPRRVRIRKPWRRGPLLLPAMLEEVENPLARS